MKNKVLCSTGTFVNKFNDYNYYKIPSVISCLDCDGVELMTEPALYDMIPQATDYLAKSGISFDIIHSDKRIGVMLSEKDYSDAIKRFDTCCRAGVDVGAKRLVLHLWGGPESDNDMPYMLDALGELYNIASGYSIKIIIENVPCVYGNPLDHWKEIIMRYPEAKFVYDVRFGEFHLTNERVFDEKWFENGYIDHVHISDFAGPSFDFKGLRPIKMPGEGLIGERFPSLLKSISSLFNGTITLESPAWFEDGSTDTERLNKALCYIKDNI